MRGMADCILLPTVDQWDKCREVQLRYKISYWDSMLAASCILAGLHRCFFFVRLCRLLSEGLAQPHFVSPLQLLRLRDDR